MLSDVDGTLLGASRLPSLAVGQAVGAARASGAGFGVATGRHWSSIRRLAEALDLDGPHVLHNGAEIRQGGAVLERWPLPRELARALLERCLAHGWYAEFYLDEGYVVTDVRAPAREHWSMLEDEPIGTTRDVDIDDHVAIKATVIVFDPAQLDVTLAGLRELGVTASAGFGPATPALRFVNVTAAQVDKGRAVRRAAAAVGSALEDLVVLGDGYNDLALFEPAGTAVAMGQAPEQVQAAAHLVAPPVTVDGAAVALQALAQQGATSSTSKPSESST